MARYKPPIRTLTRRRGRSASRAGNRLRFARGIPSCNEPQAPDD